MFARLPLLRRSFATSPATCSGHNKWSKIKQKKGANDAQKSEVFARTSREIANAVRLGGGSADPEKNTTLANVLKRAKAQGVPKDNIENALKKITMKGKDGSGQDLVYEAIAYDTVGLIIECSSDNVNRTGKTIREILSSYGARLAPVGFMFQRQGYVKAQVELGDKSEERLEEIIDKALSSGAEDFHEGEDASEIEFTCPPQDLNKVVQALSEISTDVVASEVIYAPVAESNDGDGSSEEVENKVYDLKTALEECEDTVNVWTSLDS